MSSLGLVVIGRNEGPRLRRCLEVLRPHGLPTIYVDSASADGSPDLARSFGVTVVDLDASRPFNAARARNAGFERLVQDHPAIEFVQFIDGDCELLAGWLDAALAAIAQRPDVAVVCGRRRERFPEASIYNRLADIEWHSPVGEALACGGDFLVRAGAFQQVGGLDTTILAGEEPEMCHRLRGRNWKILRIDHDMTLHDAAMTRFSQWWRRTVRSGFGCLDVTRRTGREGRVLFAREIRSSLIWGIGWPLAVVVAAVLGAVFGGMIACLLAAGCIAALWPLQVARVALRQRNRMPGAKQAIAYALLMMIGKWAQIAGYARYCRIRLGASADTMPHCLKPVTAPAAQAEQLQGASK